MLDDARLLAQVKTPEEPEEEEQPRQQAVEDTAQFQSRARILDMLSGLDQKEAELLTLRFGLEGKPPGDAGGSWKTAWDFAPGGFADGSRSTGKAPQRSEKRNSFPIEQQKAGLPYGKENLHCH